MQLHNILPQFSARTQEDQLALVKQIRHNKLVLKPDVKKKQRKKAAATAASEAKKSTAKRDRALAMLDSLSPEQKLQLLKELQS